MFGKRARERAHKIMVKQRRGRGAFYSHISSSPPHQIPTSNLGDYMHEYTGSKGKQKDSKKAAIWGECEAGRHPAKSHNILWLRKKRMNVANVYKSVCVCAEHPEERVDFIQWQHKRKPTISPLCIWFLNILRERLFNVNTHTTMYAWKSIRSVEEEVEKHITAGEKRWENFHYSWPLIFPFILFAVHIIAVMYPLVAIFYAPYTT